LLHKAARRLVAARPEDALKNVLAHEKHRVVHCVGNWVPQCCQNARVEPPVQWVVAHLVDRKDARPKGFAVDIVDLDKVTWFQQPQLPRRNGRSLVGQKEPRLPRRVGARRLAACQRSSTHRHALQGDGQRYLYIGQRSLP
jgi:hypothetical protein